MQVGPSCIAGSFNETKSILEGSVQFLQKIWTVHIFKEAQDNPCRYC